METQLTMAGLQATAGAARLHAVAPATCPAVAAVPSYGVRAHQVSAPRHLTTWIQGAFAAVPASSMAFDGKNRPTRPLSELSP